MANYENYINLSDALARVGGNKTLYKRLLGMFLNSKEFALLDGALAKGDIEEAAKAAHGIKGVTGNLALSPLFEVSTNLMNRLREGVLDEELLEDYRVKLVETRRAVEEFISLN